MLVILNYDPKYKIIIHESILIQINYWKKIIEKINEERKDKSTTEKNSK